MMYLGTSEPVTWPETAAWATIRKTKLKAGRKMRSRTAAAEQTLGPVG